jgi:hypothetical protein
VDVDVVSVAVNGAHALVLAEPERADNALLDQAQRCGVRLLPRGEG